MSTRTGWRRRAGPLGGALLAAASLAGLVGAATAHPLAPALLEVRAGPEGAARVVWKTPRVRPRGESLSPVLPDDCRPVAPATLREENGARIATTEFRCAPGPWTGRRLSVAGLRERGSNALVRFVREDGEVVQAVLTRAEAELIVPARASRGRVAADYLRLGVEHLLFGWDHVLFLLALLLLVGFRPSLVWAITAFTVGHSVTLAFATLGWVRVPEASVELAISASILWMAAELVERDGSSPFRRRPWLVTLAFGLLHGLGFAGALAQVGLPQREIPLALLSFNVGIEVGQLALVLVAAAVWPVLRRIPHPAVRWPGLAQVPAYAIGGMAGYWLLERGIGWIAPLG